MSDRFRALVVREQDDGSFSRSVEEREVTDLPDADLLIRVRWSSLNYKDMLSATGHRGVTRRYPHTPGIDAAGVILRTRSDQFQVGDEVVVTGRDLGMNTPGGFGQIIAVPAEWVLPKPPGLTLRECMAFGTAGLTAGLCVTALEERRITPDCGPVLVTGATGGVGTFAVKSLRSRGCHVVAATGKPHHPHALRLGANEVIHRDEILDPRKRPLLPARWAAVIDTVGGDYLDSAIRATAYGGVVTVCGMVASPQLETNVFPFILRGVRLEGIDSAEVSLERLAQVWHRLAEWKPNDLFDWTTECSLDDLDDHIERMRQGLSAGRTLVRLD